MMPDTYSIIIVLLTMTVESGTILLFPVIGEIFAERSGILNLGIEGMMIVGALVGFATTYITGQVYFGFFILLSLSSSFLLCGKFL